MLHFRVVAGQEEGRSFDLSKDVVRIGRAPECEVALPDWHISAEHAVVHVGADRTIVRDAHSTNGTRIRRGDQIVAVSDAPGQEAELRSGDALLLGDPEHPVILAVAVDEEPDTARIVSLLSVKDLGRVEATVGADREILHRLYDAQKAITRALEVEDVLEAVAGEVFRLLSRATHVTVAMRDDDDPSKPSAYLPVGTRVRGMTTPAAPVPVTRSVFRKVVAERAAVLAADAPKDVGETASLMAAHILSTMGVPLWIGDEILGVLQVDNRAASGIFGEGDLDVLAVLAQSASQAFHHARLYQRLRVAEERQRSENVYLKKREKSQRFGGIIGESAAMRGLLEQLKKAVHTRVTVLIEGETGTGKELIASAVHYWSPRAEKLFVAQNCAAMPENLLESELFGHKRGAFTGATDDKRGLFEVADGGTLFLDEIGEMPLSLQAKLLRVLQEGEIRPVGSNTTKRVDTRIVAATNRDLEKEVREGRFREDLFYRLRVFPVRLPPLRERREDVVLLANHFLRKYSQEFGRAVRGFSQEATELLQAYQWPGNVRELENEIQRIVIQVGDGEFVRAEHVSGHIRQVESVIGRVQPAKGTLREMMDQVEKWILLEALREHGNNKTATAKSLGITREGLHKKLKGFGIG